METLNCKTEIVNRALSLLREKEIIDISIEPSSDTERLIHKWFETAKAECIMEIEPPFAIKRLKLNVEKIVNSETLEEIKGNINKTIDFKDWMKSVINNNIDELKKEIEKLLKIKADYEEQLAKEINKKEEEQDIKQKNYLKRLIKRINLKIIILKTKIRFMEREYKIYNKTSINNIGRKEDNNNNNNIDLLLEEETEQTPSTTIPTTPLTPAKPTELLKHFLRRRKVIFYRELKRREQIRRYEEYEAWKQYNNQKYRETKNNNNNSILFAYRIPSDCLKIFDKNFELFESNYIYSYLDNGLTIKYLSNNTELYSREIKFNIALSYLLAYYICADLQNNDDKIQLFFKLKNNKISEARTNNLREIGVSIIKNYRWKK